MKFDTRDIREKAKKNFEKTWLETAGLLPEKSDKNYIGGKGLAHPLYELMADVRKIFLSIGFDEIENSIFIPEEEVYWQYGPEAPVILDRCYYLAGLPRPDIGLSENKINEIKKIASIDINVFKKILREYREGVIDSDDLIEEMVNKLGIKAEKCSRIIELFPEFRTLKPIPERTTLRSHMTAAWFPTLKAMQHKAELPIRLFSTGIRFRREQRLDATHLKAHYGASCVILDEKIGMDAGKKITEEILKKLGFRNLEFIKKKATSNYYAPETEFEVHSEGIEIADCGMYSPLSLANYDIKYPVFNLGFGLERILMLMEKKHDIREILYPQFYKVLKLTDMEIAKQVRMNKIPETGEGRKLAELISVTAMKHADEKSPCRFLVYDGKFLDKNIRVNLVEREENTLLLGPAAMNDIYVYDGNIYGIPKEPEKLDKALIKVKSHGIKVEFSYLDAISNYFSSEIEDIVTRGGNGFIQIKMAKTPGDVNISVGDVARRFITSNNKEILIKGPIFTAVEVFVS